MFTEVSDEICSIHTKAIKRGGFLAWSNEDRRFLSLALCGEVGELANFVKKQWRGELKDFQPDIEKEIADIQIYLILLAKSYGIDLEQAIQNKLPEIRAKFGA